MSNVYDMSGKKKVVFTEETKILKEQSDYIKELENFKKGEY